MTDYFEMRGTVVFYHSRLAHRSVVNIHKIDFTYLGLCINSQVNSVYVYIADYDDDRK